MKILLITEFFPTGKDLRFSGGVEARTFFIAKHLSKNHQISVIAAKIKNTPKIEKMFGFTIYRVGPKRDYTASVGHLFSRISYIRDAIQMGKSLDADIIDGGNYISHLIVKQISSYKKIPSVAWYPDVWLNNWIKITGLYGVFGEILERLNLARGFDSYIAISKNTASKLRRFTKKNINVIYCGVDKKEFAGKVSKFKNPTIICISRLAKYKNIKTLIYAFGLVTTKLSKAKLLIVGTGPEEKNLKSQIKALKLTRKVEFFSNLPRKELVKLYKSSHVFCLPSLVEGFGIATIEAATAGLPYVNSNIPIQREVTKGGVGGFLVNPTNPYGFSQKFLPLLTDKRLYRQKSRQVISLANYYNWEEITHQTLEVYETLVKR